MRKMILSILVLLFVQNLLFADKLYYTVMAMSGLSIRKDKDINSEKLNVVKFGGKVQVLEIFEEDKITIEQTEGFWIKIKYKNKEGYMYSGYLYPGEISITEITDSKYIIIDEVNNDDGSDIIEDGTYDILNYLSIINDKKWYGVRILDSRTILSEIKINLEISPKNIQIHHLKRKTSKQFYYNSLQPYPINYEIIGENNFDFILGTNENIQMNFNSQIVNKFIYPWEEFKLEINNHYALWAEELINKSRIDSTIQEISYELFIKHFKGDKVNIPFINKGPAKQHARYKSPSIVWIGMLNQDNLPDFIISESIMEDKCGPPWLNLVISSQHEGVIKYKVESSGIDQNSIR